MNLQNIPSELRARPQWVAWKYGKKKDGSITKLPVNVATGKLASTADPATWATFDDVIAKQNGAQGPGYMFSKEDPFCGVDFDGCRNPETGEIAPWARERIIKLNTYAEVSPSKTGVKAWARAKWPLPNGKKITLSEPDFVAGKKLAVEVYDHGRYFAVTGLKLANLPDEPQERQAEIDELCKAYFSERAKTSGKTHGNASGPSVIERARKYIDKMPQSVSGSGGHSQTFRVACVLVLGFGLTKAESLGLLGEYNRRCEPSWNEKELQHKIDSADAQPGERGYLRDKRPDEWAGTSIPDYQEQPAAAAAQPAPIINASDQDLDRATRFAWDALVLANDPPYMFRHGTLTRIERDENGAPVLKELTIDRVRHELARKARYQTRVKDKEEDNWTSKPAHPPMPVVKNVLATPNPPLPALNQIVEVPVFAADGTLQTEPGYNRACRTYYAPDPSFSLPYLPLQPSHDDLVRARVFIDYELLPDFPFAADSEKTNAAGLYLLPYVRPMIEGPTPLHLIEKPCQGTGATLLADVISYPAIGRGIAATTEGRDEDEWRKRLTAKLAAGPSFILFDNLRRRLDSANVSAAITAITWEDRRLGHSETILIPVRCCWIATGNNPALSGEIARRTVRIRLDAKMDQPWLRTGFRHPDLRAWMKSRRADLVWAALVLVRWWIAQGRPKAPASVQRLGGFECWAEVVGGILAAAEYEGFLANLQEFYASSDVEGTTWRGFVDAWWQKYQEGDVGVSDLYPLGEELDLGDGNEKSQKTRLGNLLRASRDRQFGDLRIVSAPKRQGASRYRLALILSESREPREPREPFSP